MATYSSVLAWRIPGTGEPGSRESDMTEVTAAAAAIDWLFITSMNYHCLSRFLHSKQAHPLESPSSISFTTVPGSDTQNVANLTFNTWTKSISECQFSYNSILGIFFFFLVVPQRPVILAYWIRPRDLSLLTRDQSCASCIGSAESF